MRPAFAGTFAGLGKLERKVPDTDCHGDAPRMPSVKIINSKQLVMRLREEHCPQV